MRPPILLRRVAYPIAKRRYARRQAEREDQVPVVVLTMGKAGSTAIVRALDRDVPERPCYQVHYLSEANLRRAEAGYRRTTPGRWPQHVFAGYYLRGRWPTTHRPWDIVCPVREPIGRDVAAYFQTAARFGNETADVGRALKDFLAFRQGRSATTWFDREVRAELGIDVYDHPFDPAAGFARIDAPGVRLLLIRQENLDGAIEILSDFLGHTVSSLGGANVGADKVYAEDYRRFRAEVALPPEVLDEAYDSTYARHFYSPEEIRSFRSAWERSTHISPG